MAEEEDDSEDGAITVNNFGELTLLHLGSQHYQYHSVFNFYAIDSWTHSRGKRSRAELYCSDVIVHATYM